MVTSPLHPHSPLRPRFMNFFFARQMCAYVLISKKKKKGFYEIRRTLPPPCDLFPQIMCLEKHMTEIGINQQRVNETV